MTVKDKKYHHNIDLLGLILKNAQVQTLTADPATTYPRIYWNSADSKYRMYVDGTGWTDLGSGAGSGTVETITSGDGSITVDDTDAANPDLSVADSPLLEGEDGAHYLARANHTGTQPASTISDFDTQVRTSTLNQMAAPTADVSINSHRLTNVTDPSSAQDAATKAYVDTLLQGVRWKAPVRAATTAALTLATDLEDGDAIDGVTLATGDRVLVKDQASGAENGIYIVAASGAPTRAGDADTSGEMQGGVATFVQEGTTQADSGWVLSNDGTVTLGTTALTFVRFTGLADVNAGAGLTKTGNTIDAVAGSTPGTGGPGGGLKANANDLVVDTDVVVTKYAETIGDGATADIAVTHGLGTRDVTVAVFDADSPYAEHDVYAEATDANTVTIFFDEAPDTDALRVVVQA